MSFTPGPWHIAESGRAAVVLDEDVRVIAKTWPHVRDGNDPSEVAEAAANARLIAAAPELLKLLEHIRDHLVGNRHSTLSYELQHEIAAAIAKAMGTEVPA